MRVGRDPERLPCISITPSLLGTLGIQPILGRAMTEQEGLVNVHGSEIEVTPLGRIFVRNVACVFDAYLAHGERIFSRAV